MDRSDKTFAGGWNANSDAYQKDTHGPQTVTRDNFERVTNFGKKRGRPCNSNAARERSRVKTLRAAFLELQQTLPSVPPDTKLSKLDVLVLATTYISHLMRTLEGEQGKVPFCNQGFMHPVKKWPMRTRLYAGILASTANERREENQLETSDMRHYESSADW